MIWRVGFSRRKLVACLAALCVLVQAGLVAWHISIMFAAAAHNTGEQAVLCHATVPVGTAAHRDGAPADGNLHASLEGCACCQGLLAGGTMPQGVADLSMPRPHAAPIATLTGTLAAGSHPLAADSRAPPPSSDSFVFV